MRVMATLHKARESREPIPAPRTCKKKELHALKIHESSARATIVVMSSV